VELFQKYRGLLRTAVLEENDTEFLLGIIGALARSEGMTQIAGELVSVHKVGYFVDRLEIIRH
jgi:DNA-binding phage protein